ncbi:HAD family hydrolase [Actinospica sp.]|jgi:HAD superfamily hydrolase (TIGR01549 family)|uniref:HAD family hydrolase n=1 Tax=Actinospica sp. TaxID=1872142 RepID=UPI002CFF9C02|nr:HAD family hydrolase [Actinospica sp.]HWG23547.1 HAD family hydrolase [Actinospica sp.]
MSFAFFDLDDTLVDTRTALHAWALDFVAEYGIGDGNDELAAAHVVTRRAREVDTWLEFAEKAREWYGIATPVAELFDEFAESYARKFTLSPTVAAGLTRLRDAGWLLGIVTNGMTRVQHGKIDHVCLRDYVDAVIDSQSAGYRKPDRRIFELAAGKLGVELGPDGWMVGDMLSKDVEGGIAAGLRTIWLPYDVVRGPADPRPEFAAASIDEAIALVERAGGPE